MTILISEFVKIKVKQTFVRYKPPLSSRILMENNVWDDTQKNF